MRRYRSRIEGLIALWLFLSLVPASPGGAAEVNRYLVDTGPLRIRDQFLLGMGFLGFDPVSADIVEPGKWQLDLIVTVTNTFALSGMLQETLEQRERRDRLTLDGFHGLQAAEPGKSIFLVDGELHRYAIAARRGITPRFQLEVVVPVLSFRGGAFDSVVEGFHDTFGYSQVGRTGVPRDAFVIFAGGRNREFFTDEAPGTALGDAVVGAKFALLRTTETRRFNLSVEGLVKLPTGESEPLFSSGELDVGAQLLTTRYYRKACLHAAVGLLFLAESESVGTGSQVLPAGMIAFERSLGRITTGVAQLSISESPFRDLELDELAETSLQVTLGLKRVVRASWVLFAGITENFANFNSSPDFGLHLGLTKVID